VKRALALAALLASVPALASPEPGAAYGDGMVLQRGEPILISGTSAPGSTVEGTLGTDTASATTGSDGTFTLTFPARTASTDGISLTLRDADGETVLHDILIGDVYLCSGQSNMELSVNRALNTWNELRLSPDDGMRLLTVPKSTAAVPQTEFSEPVVWRAADADSVAEFSAACYYMGKQLRADHRDVPLGLIHSNWGGSAARAWFTPESVAAMYGDEALAQLRLYQRDPLAAAHAFAGTAPQSDDILVLALRVYPSPLPATA